MNHSLLHHSLLAAAVTLCAGMLFTPIPAQADIFKTDQFRLYGDFRLRLESDWDSQNSSGTDREDRDRARIRARLGLQYDPSEHFSFGFRVRTGSDDSHQSPHITIVDFEGNDTGDSDLNADKWYLKAKNSGFWGWAGRNSLPFWKQNELFWDDDVTPSGLAGGGKWEVTQGTRLGFNLGYLSLPVGMQEFSGNMGLGQVVLSSAIGEAKIKLAGGLLAIDSDSGDVDSAALLNGNGARDYEIWVVSGQAKFDAGGRPLTLGLDYMTNEEDYSATDPDPFTVANRDETEGYVVSIKWGQTKQAGDWLAAYYYARIETFAANSSYAQDDWVRWGSAVETRGTNMKGHELRYAYAFAKNINAVARLYITEAITTVEDGNRFRVDFNYKF